MLVWTKDLKNLTWICFKVLFFKENYKIKIFKNLKTDCKSNQIFKQIRLQE